MVCCHEMMKNAYVAFLAVAQKTEYAMFQPVYYL